MKNVCDQPRTYEVEVDNEKIYKRNKRFIIKPPLESQNKTKCDKTNKTFLGNSIETNLQAETKIFGRNIVKLKCFFFFN